MSSLKDILVGLASGEEMGKLSFAPPTPAGAPAGAPPMGGGAPPPAGAGAGAPPMAPQPPPAGAPPMGGGMPPQGGMPMDPGMGGGMPPQGGQMSEQEMQQLMQMLSDPGIQEMLAQAGIIVDPQQGPMEQATGRVLAPEEVMMILEEIFMMMQQQGGGMPPQGGMPMDPGMGGGMPPQGGMPMDPGMGGGMPPQGGMPMDPSMGGGGMPPKMAYEMPGMAPAGMQGGMAPGMTQGQPDPYMEPPAPTGLTPELEERLSSLEELVGQLAAKLDVENPGTPVEEGFSQEAQDIIGNQEAPAETMESPKMALEEPEELEKKASADKSRGYVPSPPKKEDAASKLSRIIGRLRSCAD